jgi:hypothetical protein
MSEQDYIRGNKAAYSNVISFCMKVLNPEERTATSLLIEREEAITALRDICHEFGDNNWPNTLHLADIIEKHLGRNLRG